MKFSSVLLAVTCGVGLSGCQLVQSLQTDDALMAQRVIAEHCEVGVRYDSSRPGQMEVEYVRLGKISKRSRLIFFHHMNKIESARVFVHSLKNIKGEWSVADASYEGRRENLYFNRKSGEFACSTDEWRAVNSAPKDSLFEISPLIVSGASNISPN